MTGVMQGFLAVFLAFFLQFAPFARVATFTYVIVKSPCGIPHSPQDNHYCNQ